MASIEEQLESFVLSTSEIQSMNPGWSEAMILDYFNIANNFNTVATGADGNTISIEGNADNIATNATDIDNNTTTINDHIALDSAHGVTGENIGTEDFAQTLIGGSVLLAALVANAAASTVSVDSPDATAAPATYNQAQIQTIVTLANEMKADINQLVTDVNLAITQLNTFIAGQQTAKQMSTV